VASSRKEFLHIATLVDIGRRDASLPAMLRPSALRPRHRSIRFFNTACTARFRVPAFDVMDLQSFSVPLARVVAYAA